MKPPSTRSVGVGIVAVLCTVALLGCAGACRAAWLTGPAGERVFVRGLAYSPYHPRDGWDLSPATLALDRRQMRRLGANCLLTWTPITSEQVSAWRKLGVYVIPQIVYTPPTRSFFADGNEAPLPIFINAGNRKGLHEAARDLGSALKDNPGVLAISLGNGYAWSAFSADLGFSYAGFDTETVAAFAAHLKRRFTSVAEFNRLAGSEFAHFEHVLPTVGLSRSPVFGEWWMFMRDTFADYLEHGREGLRAVGWDCPTTYETPCGIRWDPASEGCRLPFLDITSGNVFYEHTQGWGDFCVTIDRLISDAPGKPVLVSETGAHTLRVPAAEASRMLRQSVACALLHPELAGVCLYEYCDDWTRSGNPNSHDDINAREHWGLVTGNRIPKHTFHAASAMLGLIKRFEVMFQEWQAPPVVWLGRQDIDWWKIGGREGVFYTRVAAELYRHGIPFRLAPSEALLQLDPGQHAKLILCDSYLAANPDGSDDVLGHVVSYVESGGDLLYISRMPWLQLYGKAAVPAPLRALSSGAPTSGRHGSGRYSIIPTYDLDDEKLRYLVEDYLRDEIEQRPITEIRAPGGRAEVFWRVLEAGDGLKLFAVNVGKAPIPRLDLKLGPGMDAARFVLHDSDGAQLARTPRGVQLLGLNTYALVHLGKPETGPHF